MYFYRFWQPRDLPWIEQAATAATWETMDLEERASVHPGNLMPRVRQQLHDTLQSPGGMAIILTRGFRPVGYSMAAIAPDATTGEPNGHLLMVWVDPAHRRQGLGQGLLRHTEDMAARAGIRKLKLWTGLHNQAAYQLAQKSGYAPEGVIGMKQL